MLFAKVTIYYNMTMKYAEKHIPRQECESCRGVGDGCGLVEADASDGGFFDESGIVALGLVEGKGDMLDAVRHAEFFEEQDELTQFFNEPVLIFSRGDGDEYHHVIGKVVDAVRVREDDD